MEIGRFSVQAKSGEMRIPHSTEAMDMRGFSWLRFRLRAVSLGCTRCGEPSVHLDMEREPPDFPKGAWRQGFLGRPDADTAN